MTPVGKFLKLRALDGRLTVEERASLVESYLQCEKIAEKLSADACAEVALILSRHAADRASIRKALRQSLAECESCRPISLELLSRL